MTNCVKCGAELIGSRKFCAACGAPTDPSSLKREASIASPNAGSAPAAPISSAPATNINVPSTAYGPPNPGLAQGGVNPFAATASPSSRAVGSPYGPPPATSANPPSGAPGPLDGTQPAPPVSPLAVSNALSQRGAFQQVAGDRVPASVPGGPQSSPTGPAPRGTGTSPPPPHAGSAAAKKAPGTQLMPSMQNPSVANPASRGSSPPGSNVPSAAATGKPPPQKTQLMDASSFVRPSASRPSASNQPSAQPAPPSIAHQPQPYGHAQAPSAPVPPMQPPRHATGQPQWGWGTPAAPAAPPAAAHGYGGFAGYAPGARVNVTWSNGQRYPATVSQISGTQCLVIFPDGQQHWVEMQYLSPG